MSEKFTCFRFCYAFDFQCACVVQLFRLKSLSIFVPNMQFYHLKFGDRFYFEHGGEVGSFKPGIKNIQTINHNNL